MTVEDDLRSTEALREDLIRRRLAGNRRRRRGITPADRSGPLPLSFGQQRLWLLHQFDPASPEYLVPMAMRLRGELDPAAVGRAWDAMVARHEILRTRYAVESGQPVQLVDPPAWLDVAATDLSGLPEADRLPAALEIFEREARTPFALDRDWPLRVCLVTLGPRDHVMITVYHHIAFDGWSLGVIDAEWPALYLGYALGEPDPAASLPELPIQYGDYAAWQRERLSSGAALDRELAYWHERLAGVTPLDLPADRPRPAVRDWAGAKIEFTVPPRLTERLRKVGQDRSATLFMVLLTAFQALLSRLTGQRDICVGTPVAGRTLPELARMIGFTVNSLVIRGRWGGDPVFTDLLAETRSAVLDALDHQEVPFERLVDDLEPDRNMSRHPLFQVMFGLHNEESGAGDYGVLTAETLLTAGTVAKFDLNLHFEETSAGGLSGVLDYATALFDAETAERLVAHLRRVLEAVAADPARPVSAITRTDVTRAGAPAGLPDPEPVPGQVARQVRTRPTAVAVRAGEVSLTYAELEAEAARLAGRLRAAGIGAGHRTGNRVADSAEDRITSQAGSGVGDRAAGQAEGGVEDRAAGQAEGGAEDRAADQAEGGVEDRVAVCLPRGAALVAALFGVWRAGAAYVPLDPAHPDARLAAVVADSGARLVVTDAGSAGRFRGTPVLVVDEPGGTPLAAEPVDPDSLAYVIYTSGSTGAPKGVAVTHRNLARLLTVTRPGFAFTPGDVWTCCHSAAFDFSAWEVWGALASGGRVVVVPADVARAPDELLDLLGAERVTVLSQTPSAFGGLVAAAGRDDPRLAGLRLRLVVLGGERLETAGLAPWFARFGTGGPELVNMYGITETTVHVTAHRVTGVEEGEGSRIGRPLDDLDAVVVDGYGDPAPPGVRGDLHVGGAGVARGYLNNPGLTAERFVPDPDGPPGSRRYRSGDLARVRPDGTLEFLGRLDDQLALRGHRVEPAEVEAALIRHPDVAQAAVTVRAARLVAYVTGAADPVAVRRHCAALLPPYLVPALVVPVAELPLTANGKVDRRALPDPEITGPPMGAPRTRTEALMLAVWTRALGRGGVDEDFFESGGDSLRAVTVVGELRAAGFDVSVRDVFEHRTVARLAALADGRPAAEQRPPVAPFELLPGEDLPGDAVDAYPLSQLQAGMVYQSMLHPGRGYYHDVISFSVRDDRPFDERAFLAAAAAVTRRHENLRTSVHLAGYSVPAQIVHAAAELPVEVEDLRGSAVADAVEARLARERERAFDLATAPLMRLAVQIEADDRWRLWMTVHHVIIEGWSHHQLLMELLNTYRGHPVDAEPATVRHADFVAAELAALDSPDDRNYWSRVLTRHRRWTIPDGWGDPGAAGEIDQVHLNLLDDYEGLLRLAAEAQVPLKSVLLAAHLKVLAACTPDASFHTGLLCDARPEAAGADRVHGMFLAMVPLAFTLRAPTWRDLAREVFAAEVEVWPHRRFPLPELARRWGDGAELLPAFFNYLDFHMVDGEMVDLGESLGELPHEFPLMVTTSNGVLTLTTHRGAVSRANAARLADAYRAVIAAMAADPGGDALAALFPALPAPGAATASHGGPVPEAIATQASRTPDAVAVTSAKSTAADPAAESTAADSAAESTAAITSATGTAVSYAALHERARSVAGLLARAGAGPERVVGVRVARGADLVAALLGVWYAGAAYLPIDPAWPAKRVTEVLADAGAVALLGESPAGGLPCFAPSGWGDARPINPVEIDPDTLAYVIFTSGSTGRPKGVEVTHRNLSGYISTAAARGSAPLLSSPAYDLAVSALFLPLVTGGRVHVLPDVTDVSALPGLLTGGGPYDFVKLTPSHLDILTAARPVAGTWLVGGETLPTALARRLLAAAPGSVIVNEYGPTEATVACAVHTATTPAGLGDAERVPIGRPMPGATVRVRDRWYEPAPTGVPGEIMIGGAGVARGYRRRPALTAERFVPDPDGPPGSRMYRTGDLGRVLDSGDLDLLGRTDDQVKIRGHRVEPGETSAVLASHPGVRNAVTVPAGDRLVSYAVPERPESAPEETLSAWLRERLPAPQVPWRIVTVDAIPLTPGGKLDRAALPEAGPPARSRPPRAPETPTEQALAAVWQDVLQTDVHADDDFFDLGGHSLLILRAVALAAGRGLALRAADILELRTVGAVARRIDTASRAPGPLFPLNNASGRPPVIAVHPAGGSSHWYVPLAERLPVPVAALTVPDLATAADIGTLAGHYLPHLPGAPVHLFAWSSGSVIAWELARRLIALGRPPSGLTLADPMTDLPESSVGEETFDELERLLSTPGGGAIRRGLTSYRAKRLLNDLGIAAGRDDLTALAGELRLWRTLDRATAAYRFTPLDIPVRLVASDDCASGRHSVTGHLPYDRYLARWRELAGGGLTVTRLGSSHRGLFHPPYVDTLARITNEVTHDDR